MASSTRRITSGMFLCVTILLAPATVIFGTTRGITAIAGVKVGNHSLTDRPTGCTVILVESGATAAVDVRGASPGTREIALLDPTNIGVQRAHAVVLAGGSAFGLAAADGTMRYLSERGIGVQTRNGAVPIVPAAILYDLDIGDPTIRPTADCGYQAAVGAHDRGIDEGNVGAGAGATVGKLAGISHAMKGGLGSALAELPSGIQIAALMVTNAVGDIIDPGTGKIIAGARTDDGLKFIDVRTLIRNGTNATPPRAQNTTIGVVVTNVAMTVAELSVVARMAHDGLARAIWPAHTPADGDTIFALSTGTHAATGHLLNIGALAADVTAEAVVRGVSAATSIPGYPAAVDLEETTR